MDNDFKKFMQEHKDDIDKIVSKNPTVITKDDEWRQDIYDILAESHTVMSEKAKENGKKLIEKFDAMEDDNIPRYCSVKESIEESLKQIKEMRDGKLPKKSWREYKELYDKWLHEIDKEELRSIISKNPTTLSKDELNEEEYIMEDIELANLKLDFDNKIKKLMNEKLDVMLKEIRENEVKDSEEMLERNAKIMEILKYEDKCLQRLIELTGDR